MTKITQKNYEAICIYRQKEKIFELKGKVQTLKQQLAVAIEALKLYAYGQIQSVEENIDGEDEVVTYPYSNDDGEAAKEALVKIQSVPKRRSGGVR